MATVSESSKDQQLRQSVIIESMHETDSINSADREGLDFDSVAHIDANGFSAEEFERAEELF